MPGAVTLDNRTIVLPMGQDVTLLVRIRNLGQVVDGFIIDVLGQPGAWAQVNPPETRLFPDTEGSVEVKFRQPENAPPVAGSHPFAVRIRSREDPNWVAIEEGTVEIGAKLEINVEIRPKTSSGRSTGKHQVIVDNLGNAPVWVQVVGDDPDDLFRFNVDPPDVALEPRTAGVFDLKAKLARKPPKGTTRVPFVVSVLADGRPTATADGGFSPRKLPWKPLLVVAAALVAGAIALYQFRQTDAESQAEESEATVTTTTTTTAPVTTTTGGGETTTTAPPGENGGGPLGERLDEPQVLFASDRDGDFELFIANLDGSDAVPITNNGDFDGDPTFSPDGTEAVFVRTVDENRDLFRLDIDDCDPSDPATCEPERLTASLEDESFPDFSPDGETIVFSRDTAGGSSAESDLDLFAIDLDSGEEVQITSEPGDESRPQFSPDGSRIAFDGPFGGDNHVHVVDSTGGEPVPVTPGRSIGSSGAQFVDADTLVYARQGVGEARVLVELDFQTNDPERVLFDEPALELTSISKDGERIVFQSVFDLFVSDLDGDNAERITDGEGFNFEGDLFEPED